MDTLNLREAAELCETTVKAMRNRADRGTIKTVVQDGERRVPITELERAGLLPDAELRELRADNQRLRDELATSRQLVVSTERAAAAERQARERLEAALHERQAAALQAEAVATAEAAKAAAAQADADQAKQETAEAVAASDELQALEADLRAAGPIRAWKLARGRRRTADAV